MTYPRTPGGRRRGCLVQFTTKKKSPGEAPGPFFTAPDGSHVALEPAIDRRDAAVVPGPLDLLVRHGELLPLRELDEIRVADVGHAEVDRREVRVGQLHREVVDLVADARGRLDLRGPVL